MATFSTYTKQQADTLLAGKATPAQITAAISQFQSDLLAGAPTALNTLDELSAALGDDANFAATVTTILGTKAPLASPAFTGAPTISGAAVAKTTDITTVSFPTVAAMKATRPVDATYATTGGYWAAGDRGAAQYRYDAASTATDNGGSVLTPTTGSGAGRWLLVSGAFGIISTRQFGVKGDATNETAALTAWCAYLTATGLAGYWDGGNYRASSGLSVPIEGARIRGAGMGVTFVQFLDSNNDGLTIGPGPSGGTATPNTWMSPKNFGHVEGVSLFGPTANPTKNVKAALVINTLRHTRVMDVHVGNFDIGVDFRNNCFGSYGMHIVADESCNVGLNLRNGDGSGSDLPFYNCWVAGGIAGVHISGGGGGFGFYGGQIGAGLPTADACVVLGKDYETGAIEGTHNIGFFGVDFESWYNFAFHSYNTHPVIVDRCLFGAYRSGPAAQGLVKIDNPYASAWSWRNNLFVGTTQGNLLQVTGVTNQGTFSIMEEGWSTGIPSTVNGVTMNVGTLLKSLQDEAGLYFGIEKYVTGNQAVLSIQGLKLRRNSSTGALEAAPQGSTTYAPLGGSAVVDNGDGTFTF